MSTALSVIIPTFNRAETILATIASVANCGVPGTEIVVVDDGSTDDTGERLRAFGDRIIYARQANAGPSAARNHGFDLSRGRYVVFLDSDDQWQAGTAGQLVDLLDGCPQVDVVFADAHLGNAAWGFRPSPQIAGAERLRHVAWHEPVPGFRVLERGAFFRALACRNLFNLGAAIVRRDAFASSGGFTEALCHGEDWEVYLRLASRHTFGWWPELLLLYNVHPGERLSSDPERMVQGYAQALESVLQKCPWLSPAEQACLQDALGGQRFGHAYAAYDRGQYAEAARRFAAVPWAAGWGKKALPYRCLCALPGTLVRGIRAGKQLLARREPECCEASAQTDN